MNPEMLAKLCIITPEEQSILNGRTTIDRGLYMHGNNDTINSRKLLAAGKVITIRPHTRFIHFPQHKHDYVEMVYMCAGSTTHVVNGKELCLKRGELLLMNQAATHEVMKADTDDVAINFIVLPDFFVTTLVAIGEEQTPLRRFLVDCLCGQNTGSGYLHYKVSDVPVIQNLIETLLWTIIQETPNKRNFSQMTMTLLFLQLMANTEMLVVEDREEGVILKVLRYIESNYVNGSLTELSKMLHYDLFWLSKQIKQHTGKNYTELVQEKRLAQAAFLLRNTDRNVVDIAHVVGYENIGYFHKIFRSEFGVSPRQYRLNCAN